MDQFASALDTAAAIRSKEVSPLEVLDATLSRIDRDNPELNAVIWRNDRKRSKLWSSRSNNSLKPIKSACNKVNRRNRARWAR